MSWDVLIVKAPPSITSARELPISYFDEPTETLGPAEKIREIIADVCASVDTFEETKFGATLEGDGYVGEISLDAVHEPTRSLWFHVRGIGGAAAIPILGDLCEQSRGRAYDTSVGEFIDFANHPATGFYAWLSYQRGFSYCILAKDLDRAQSFYGKLFGWKFDTIEWQSRDYWFIDNRGCEQFPARGVMLRLSTLDDIKSDAGIRTITVSAKHLDQTVERARSLEAEVIQGPAQASNSEERRAILRDSEQNVVTLRELVQ